MRNTDVNEYKNCMYLALTQALSFLSNVLHNIRQLIVSIKEWGNLKCSRSEELPMGDLCVGMSVYIYIYMRKKVLFKTEHVNEYLMS